MTNDEARYYVALALRATGCLVYEGRERAGRRAVPDVVVMDPFTGASARVRVMVGKRPKDSKRLYFDARRVGLHADVVALVDRGSGAVEFRAPETVEAPRMTDVSRQGVNLPQIAATGW